MKILSLAAAACIASASVASAAPVLFSYEGTVESAPGFASISGGDTMSIDLVMDNGGADIFGQTWNVSDFVSVVISIGSYTATGSTFEGGSGSATTDLTGALTSLNFDPIEFSGSDTDGNSFFEVFLNSYNNVLYLTDSFGDQTGASVGTVDTPDIANVTVSQVAAVPLPASALLLLSGLAGAAAVGRRRKAA